MSLKIATRIAQLIPSNSIDDIKQLLSPYSIEQRRFIMSTDVGGSSFLFYAILHRSSSVVKYFLDECGADPNSFGTVQCGKQTCLSKAVSLDSKVIVEILLRRGADINGVSFDYKTALATACFMNNLEMTKSLVENGANISTEDIQGKDSLIPSSSNCDIIKYLIVNGANSDMMDTKGNTMLMKAVMLNQKETVSFLLSRQDINIRIKNRLNEDALSLAIYFAFDDIVWMIIRRGGYTKEEVIRAYELGSYFTYLYRRNPKSTELWQKLLWLRNLPIDTPIFNNLLADQTFDIDISLFTEHDKQALLYIRKLHGPRHVLTLRAISIALNFVNVYQNFLEIYERFSKILFSLNCDEFLQIHTNMEHLFTEYILDFSEEATSFEKFIEILHEYTLKFYAKYQQFLTPSTREFYTAVSEEFQDYLIKLIHLLKSTYKSSIDIIYKEVEKIIKIPIKHSTRLFANICLKKRYISIFGIFLSCGYDVNKTDGNNDTILHYLLDSTISRKRRLIKLVVDAGFDFSRVKSLRYCLPCKMKKEGFSYYPEKCNTLQCLAAKVICQKTVFWRTDIPSHLRTIIKTHMHI